jgi:hypothetical protein
MTNVRVFNHPEDKTVWLRPVFFADGLWACQALKRTRDLYMQPVDDGLSIDDDVEFHDITGLKFVDVDRDKVRTRRDGPTHVWLYVSNAGDGSVSLRWFLTEAEALDEIDLDTEPFCESQAHRVETLVGSDVWWGPMRTSSGGTHE